MKRAKTKVYSELYWDAIDCTWYGNVCIALGNTVGSRSLDGITFWGRSLALFRIYTTELTSSKRVSVCQFYIVQGTRDTEASYESIMAPIERKHKKQGDENTKQQSYMAKVSIL